MRLSVRLDLEKVLDLDSTKLNVTVGRSADCDFVIPHKSVSRMHLKIQKQNNQFYITDLGSSNGTKLGHTKLAPHQRYQYNPNEELSIGELSASILDFNIANKKDATGSYDIRHNSTSTVRISSLKLDIPERVQSDEQIELEKRVKNPISAYTKKVSQENEKKSIKRNRIQIVVYFLSLSIIIALTIQYLYGMIGQ